MPGLSQFHADLTSEPQQTADVKFTARAAADLLRPDASKAAQTSSNDFDTYVNINTDTT